MFPPEPVRGDPCTPVMASAGHRAAGLTLLPIISPGQYMAIRTIVWLHSRILHCVGLIKLSRGKAYSNTSGHMWASASTPNSASSLAREKNRGHCTFSSNVKRSMAARPNLCHTRRTIWGWIFHSIQRIPSEQQVHSHDQYSWDIRRSTYIQWGRIPWSLLWLVSDIVRCCVIGASATSHDWCVSIFD